jgi:hypothetical protein
MTPYSICCQKQSKKNVDPAYCSARRCFQTDLIREDIFGGAVPGVVRGVNVGVQLHRGVLPHVSLTNASQLGRPAIATHIPFVYPGRIAFDRREDNMPRTK